MNNTSIYALECNTVQLKECYLGGILNVYYSINLNQEQAKIQLCSTQNLQLASVSKGYVRLDWIMLSLGLDLTGLWPIRL